MTASRLYFRCTCPPLTHASLSLRLPCGLELLFFVFLPYIVSSRYILCCCCMFHEHCHTSTHTHTHSLLTLSLSSFVYILFLSNLIYCVDNTSPRNVSCLGFLSLIYRTHTHISLFISFAPFVVEPMSALFKYYEVFVGHVQLDQIILIHSFFFFFFFSTHRVSKVILDSITLVSPSPAVLLCNSLPSFFLSLSLLSILSIHPSKWASPHMTCPCCNDDLTIFM